MAAAELLRALAALQRALNESGAPSMIIGGIAIISRGVSRDTTDVDAAVWGAAIEPEELLRLFTRHEIVPRVPDPLGFARESHMLLVEHQPTGVTFDVAFSWLPFERVLGLVREIAAALDDPQRAAILERMIAEAQSL